MHRNLLALLRARPMESAAWALALTFVGVMCALPTGAWLAHTLADDAFYYLEIARRAGESVWPTFDGRHVTTGFHPLWLMVLAAMQRVLPDDPWAVGRATGLLSSLCVFGWAVLLPRLLAPSLGARAAALAGVAVLVANGALRVGLLGMESPLAVLLYLAFLLALFVRGDGALRVGLLGGVAVLGRLDMLPAVLIALGLCALRDDRRERVRAAGAGAVVAATVAPFFVWLLARTGHLSTTSAATKAAVVQLDALERFGGRLTLGYAGWALDALKANATEVAKLTVGGIPRGAAALLARDLPTDEALAGRALGVGLVACGFLAAAWWAAGRAGRSVAPEATRASEPLRAMVLASGVHLALISSLLPGQSDRWYWSLESVTFAASVGWLASRAWGARPARALVWAQAIATAAMLVGVGLGWQRGALGAHRSFLGAIAAVAREIPSRVGPDDRVGGRNVGGLAWFTRRGVVNLDGLVNDFSMLDARRRGAVGEWVRADHVRWFADCVPRGGSEGYARSIGSDTGRYREVLRVDGGRCEGVLWRLDVDPPPAHGTAVSLLNRNAE